MKTSQLTKNQINEVFKINPFVPNAPFLYPLENIKKALGGSVTDALLLSSLLILKITHVFN